MSLLKPFAWKVFAWLPVCYGLWYFCSILFMPPFAFLLDGVLGGGFPGLIDSIEAEGNQLLVLTHLRLEHPDPETGRLGVLQFENRPLDYGYSVPLYSALLLASPGQDWERIWAWSLGMLVLLAVQLLGVGTDILKVLVFDLGLGADERLGFTPFARNALALMAYFSYLVLPALAPVLLWAAQFQGFVARLAGFAPEPEATMGDDEASSST